MIDDRKFQMGYILAMLQYLWELRPDMRFGELLTTVYMISDGYPTMSVLLKSEIYNMTDDDLYRALGLSLIKEDYKNESNND